MTLRLRPRTIRRRRRAGQALVEFALAAPMIIILLSGGAQVATIAYGHVTVATAAREVARYAAHHPDSLPSTSTPYVCGSSPNYDPTSDTSSSAAICHYVASVAGALSASNFKVTLMGDYTLADAPPGDVVRVQAVCTGQHDATVQGTVSPSSVSQEKITVSGSAGGSSPTTGVDPSGNYTLCLDASGGAVQTITATTGTGCGFYTGSIGPLNLQQGTTYTNENITMFANAGCPTPTPTPTATPTPTPTPTPTATPSSSDTPPPSPPASAQSNCLSDVSYVKVQVQYTVGVFIPFIGSFFKNTSSGHQVTETVTLKVEPCDITGQ